MVWLVVRMGGEKTTQSSGMDDDILLTIVNRCAPTRTRTWNPLIRVSLYKLSMVQTTENFHCRACVGVGAARESRPEELRVVDVSGRLPLQHALPHSFPPLGRKKMLITNSQYDE